MSGMDSLNEFYVQENMQLLEQLEEILLIGQSGTGELGKEAIEEIFRAMHTIKGSSAMMGYDSLTKLTHSIEDVFDEIRNGLEVSSSKWEEIVDVVLVSIDFLKEEILNVQDGLLPEASIDELHDRVSKLLKDLKEDANGTSEEVALDLEVTSESVETEENILAEGENCFYIRVLFEEGCAMESIRALGVIATIQSLCSFIKTIPDDLDSDCDDVIIKDGFKLYIKTTQEKEAIEQCVCETMFLKDLEVKEVTDENELRDIFKIVNINSSGETKVEEAKTKEIKADNIEVKETKVEEVKEIETKETQSKVVEDKTENVILDKTKKTKEKHAKSEETQQHAHNKNSYLTVNINKIDTLMNLVGEIVTTESMVEKQSQMENFDRDNFEKQARRLHQLTNELQDVVMSIRMVPISSTFTKMQRVVRDMSRKTGKSVDLRLIGEQTEVDKNILENISDPLMHMIRNSMDHGVETPEERKLTSKPEKATIVLEAKNTGGDVVIVIKDDGRGLNKEAIAKKAIEKGITNKSLEDISDKEAYNFILAPGFSTKEAVSEYSGRGVGMDVVYTNIRKLRGSITIDSESGKGTMIVLRIPLTLAIVDGMKVKIGDEIYIIPSLNIKEVFRQGAYEIVKNPNGEEHSIIRGNCYEIRRLSKILGVDNKNIDEGIMILVESEMGNVCIIVDSIIGQQQVVIKPVPTLLTQFEKVHSYISGCSILEDGSISLIFDINAIINL
ncbi:chemotaxis protein CheA [Paraclostridium sordellii]|uniref:Chemotaxis protein CheA n=1 Tax=Paraclostridium sordellii TaxID=1505 RepID=A0A0C7G803_PARSO|nr:chemotaxis protein CheA [Paeniclostridium sordellii]QYE97174.1 chemotaxis protein CheA [Paeniclostridium sordellii]CEN21405.1 chemotaxis protein histidine kinase-like protein [[Clostridium] sordellii] [Paeniclostridium sordellii]CEN79185.1 chemotaxis protein histidine kinase-like protein [[Clostridium] sordellii] [Paeniclostridium sordellii]CEP88357.1 chemotaxis protein histidine kinase-like protein [[Clostridium] sordellii] [Paeniclostridium sordellii]CEP97020.1 chemotaxis protein histidin